MAKFPILAALSCLLLSGAGAAAPAGGGPEAAEFPEPSGAAVTRPLPRPPPPPEEADPEAAAMLFARPAIAEALHAVRADIATGDLAAAAETLDAEIARFPSLVDLRVHRAFLAMLTGRRDAALADLEAARRHGMDMTGLGEDPVLAPLGRDPGLGARFRVLEAAPAPPPPPGPVPAAARNGRVRITSANTVWNPETERLEPRFELPETTSEPVVPALPKTATSELLREHVRSGRAAGNLGDLYDNRDRGHSVLPREAHPQLTRVVYGEAARAAEVDYGLAGPFRFDRPTLGNSSTAFTEGPYWRSLPRHALTTADGSGPQLLWQDARANALYVYPAHKDYTVENGDLLPANTPYILISRGSSGSDAPFLQAVAAILAAFRPETKALLVREGLLVPAVQMVFRRSLQNVRSRESYLSGEAHPAAFDGLQINTARMVSLANSIRPGDVPAEVRIRVEREDGAAEGVDFFGQGLEERLFDTPQAIGRIWRSKAGRREMVVSAADSRDVNGRALSFEWRLLQGDPERVRIEPLGDGSRARITLDWHEPFEISEETPLRTWRVDIGVFAHNGVHDSAPAIVSWQFPPGEARTYETGPDGAPRISEIDRAPARETETYADPLLYPRAGWRDEYRYGADGALLGWTRHREERTDAFTAEGARVLSRNPDGTPDRVEPVAYLLRRMGSGGMTVDEVSAMAPRD